MSRPPAPPGRSQRHPRLGGARVVPQPVPGVWHRARSRSARTRCASSPASSRRAGSTRAALGRPRRERRRRPRHRGVGGAVRADRRPALPRDHRPRAVLHRREAAHQALVRLGRRARHLGRGRVGRGRARGSAAGGAASSCRLRRRRRPAWSSPRRSGGSGNYFNQELLRAADHTCRGRCGIDPAHRPVRHAGTSPSTTRPSCTSRCGMSGVCLLLLGSTGATG